MKYAIVNGERREASHELKGTCPVCVAARKRFGSLVARLLETAPEDDILARSTEWQLIASILCRRLRTMRQLTRARSAVPVARLDVQLGEAAHGVYGLTRNTVYLSMMLPYVGVAFLVNSSWMLIAALPTVSPLCLTAIIAGAILLGERYQ